MPDTEPNFQCPYCMTRQPPVEVHGHLQCSQCRMVVDNCCGGAPGPDEASGE